MARDLVSVLTNVAKHRQAAFACRDAVARAKLLSGGLQDVEACLLALIELCEERAAETLEGSGLAFEAAEDGDCSRDLTAMLHGELSGHFSSEHL